MLEPLKTLSRLVKLGYGWLLGALGYCHWLLWCILQLFGCNSCIQAHYTKVQEILVDASFTFVVDCQTTNPMEAVTALDGMSRSGWMYSGEEEGCALINLPVNSSWVPFQQLVRVSTTSTWTDDIGGSVGANEGCDGGFATNNSMFNYHSPGILGTLVKTFTKAKFFVTVGLHFILHGSSHMHSSSLIVLVLIHTHYACLGYRYRIVDVVDRSVWLAMVRPFPWDNVVAAVSRAVAATSVSMWKERKRKERKAPWHSLGVVVTWKKK